MVKPIEVTAMPVPTELMMASHDEPHFNRFYRRIMEKINTLDNHVLFSEMTHGGHFGQDAGSMERCQVELFYAGRILRWLVLFNAHQPEMPPQFLCLHNPDFLEDVSVEELEQWMPSLANWESGDDDALVKVFHELLGIHKSEQLKMLREMSDEVSLPRFKVRQLLESASLSDSDVELSVYRSSVNVMVRLAVDVSRVPELLLPPAKTGHRDVMACLLLNIEESKQTSDIRLSPVLTMILGQDYKPPSLMHRENKNLPLAAFVEKVKKSLDAKITLVVGSVDARKNFLTALVTMMGRALMENDTENFSKASFLLEWNNFFFMVHCCLPNDFPRSQPIYLFQSIYHSTKQRPYTSKCSNYPYNADWSPSEMADKAKTFILEYVAKFQADSIRAS